MTRKTKILAGTVTVVLIAAIGITAIFYNKPIGSGNVAEQRPQESETPIVVNISDTEQPTAEGSASAGNESDRVGGAITQVQENVPILAKPTATPTPPKTEGSYTNPDAPPVYPEKETVKEPAKQDPTPQNGSTNSKGQIYVDGFGYVDVGGPNQGKIVDSEGDINKMVGSMD